MAKCLVVFCLLVVNELGGVPKTFIDPNINSRIFGGSNAPDGEYKHQISLQVNGSHFCSGSIVSKDYIVTAAHCLKYVHPSNLSHHSVLAGTNKLNEGGTVYTIKNITRHEDYDPYLIENDVAIMLVGPISFNEKVQPIIVDKDYVQGGQDVIGSGWGLMGYPNVYPNDLQHIHLKTITLPECRSRLHDDPLPETQICTFTKTGEGFCISDSGGPLMRSVGGAKTLVGIISFGFNVSHCAGGYPDTSVRVSSYVGWFNKTCNNCLP